MKTIDLPESIKRACIIFACSIEDLRKPGVRAHIAWPQGYFMGKRDAAKWVLAGSITDRNRKAVGAFIKSVFNT